MTLRRTAVFIVTLVTASAAADEFLRPDFGDTRGRIYGTLLWKHERAAAFPARSCAGIHSDRLDGLADVVVFAEPLVERDRRTLRGLVADEADELEWNEALPVRVARGRPHGSVFITNARDAESSFEILRGNERWQSLTVAAHDSALVRDLPDGVLRVRRAGATAEGWIFVTPWPSRVTGGNCRFAFDVPFGHYRLHGWHPYGGERSIVVDVDVTDRPPRSDLTY